MPAPDLHLRTQIRMALRELWMPIAELGGRIRFRDGTRLTTDTVPALIIRAGPGSSQPVDISFPPLLEREITIYADIVVNAGGNGADDSFEMILMRCEQLLNASEAAATLGGLVKFTRIDGEEDPEIDSTGEGEFIVFSTRWVIGYYASADEPNVSK